MLPGRIMSGRERSRLFPTEVVFLPRKIVIVGWMKQSASTMLVEPLRLFHPTKIIII
jgi:hypothetical protein